MYDNYEDGDYDYSDLYDDTWPDHACACGAAGLDACGCCGAPMCPPCYECQCGFCDECTKSPDFTDRMAEVYEAMGL